MIWWPPRPRCEPQGKAFEKIHPKLYKLNLEDIMTSCLKENKKNLEDD